MIFRFPTDRNREDLTTRRFSYLAVFLTEKLPIQNDTLSEKTSIFLLSSHVQCVIFNGQVFLSEMRKVLCAEEHQ